jgi:hypothetical protein
MDQIDRGRASPSISIDRGRGQGWREASAGQAYSPLWQACAITMSRSSEAFSLSMDVVRNIRGNITKLTATQKGRYRTVKYMLPLPHGQAAMLVSASALQFRRTFLAHKGGSKDWNHGMRLFTFTYTWRAPCNSYTGSEESGKLLEMVQPAPARFRLGWTSRTKRVEESAPQNAPAAKHRTLIGSMISSLEDRSYPVESDNPTIQLRCWASRVLTDSPLPCMTAHHHSRASTFPALEVMDVILLSTAFGIMTTAA